MNTMELVMQLEELQKSNPEGYELVVQFVQRLRKKQLEEAE